MTDAIRWKLPAAMAISALVVTACAPEEAAEFEEGEPAAADSPSQEQEASAEQDPDTGQDPSPDAEATDADATETGEDILVAEVDDPVVFEECEQAEDADDATVTWLEDVVIEEQQIADAVEPQTIELEGETVEIAGAPAVVVPERIGQAGCLIEYEAPGACLASVEISGSYIPGYQVPGREIPAVELPDGSERPALSQDEISQQASHASGSSTEGACQPEEADLEAGAVVGPVSRGAISRGAISQGPRSQGPLSNGPVVIDAGSVPGYSMMGFGIQGMGVPGAAIPGDSLEGFILEGTEGTDRAEQDEVVYYTTEGDVLFDSDEYQLRSDAESELDAIADDISEREGEYLIEVEGHTDDLPTSVYEDNYELSELRAQSVVDWLVDNADVDQEAVSAEGLGEDHPRADNGTDEGRQQNRRVVITVEPADGTGSGVDYELEEAED